MEEQDPQQKLNSAIEELGSACEKIRNIYFDNPHYCLEIKARSGRNNLNLYIDLSLTRQILKAIIQENNDLIRLD